MALLWKFLTNNLFPQNLASWVYSKYPHAVQHNLQKYQALSKSFYLTAAENLNGDYLEFGVFTGSSFVMSMRAHRQLKSLNPVQTKFYGFDSFAGFGEVHLDDQHEVYTDDVFKMSNNRVKKIKNNIKRKAKGCEYQLVDGFFQDTLTKKSAGEYGVKQARVVFIDCDLKEPAKNVFDFIKPIVQKGMILLMDDFFSYKGNKQLGVAGAYHEFCDQNPQFDMRRLFDFGLGGVAYMVADVKE